MSYSLDFDSEANLPPSDQHLSIEDLCEHITATHQELVTFFKLMITHLTAFSTTFSASIPNPADPCNSIMTNPFVMITPQSSSTTMLTTDTNQKRRAKIIATFEQDFQRDAVSYHTTKQTLLRIIQQLYQHFPQSQKSLVQQVPLSFDEIDMNNVQCLSRRDVLDLITQNTPPEMTKLRSEHEFNDEMEYISYLREFKQSLYKRVVKQYDVINKLKQDAVTLQASLTLYRSR